ncbi:polysaccharide lyase 8 family protein [Streptomyces albireticuli]|uniref:Lyase n=1 Tax=Streptomyces albireticuli TaxID=1940 RepID=A0A2A2D782_9ACTN|nr:polysaccharide lyase 8 family protein [Streptomyces albireticuli]MCD9144140.1 polysaccharide lyase 8 family protein [Streptomyces albireticuli]MCD9162217.1 polysaccharide lyase 8 family protein [Streptomyces albireticuli]MCD9193777.1 polysaccharide lyase 8 family protein [Streptomyces albireticuli]PAU47239.1 lyase [Streptomyces albireticuli]
MPSAPAWTRRGFLAASSASAAGPLGLARARPARAVTPDDFAALRRRWRALMLGDGFDGSAEPYASVLRRTGDLARAHRAAMSPGPASLWPDAPFDPPSGITRSYSRLHTMAQAYVQPGTGLTGDGGLAADVLAGLDHLHRRVYHPGTTRYGNWWEWQIGSPRLLLDTLTLLHDAAGPGRRSDFLAAVGHFVPDTVLADYTGTSTGANRVDLCRVVALRGILGADPARTALARDALSPVFPHVTKGDGLYADGSFVQHTWVAYSGTYGQVLLDGLGRLFALLRDSPWEVTDPARQVILDSVEHAYAPLIHDGLMMDSVSGRAVSRGVQSADPRRLAQSDHQRGRAVIAAVALLGDSASAAERARWHGMIRGWAARDTTCSLRADPQFGTAELARLAAVLDAPGPATPEPTGHRLFAAMDRAVHRRPGWTASIAMASDRITYYENGNGENPRGWHTGAGMLSWWGPPATTDQYGDAFWPTVDPYRMPGTTVSAKRLADDEGGGWGVPKPDARWVGGVTDGEFAVVGQHLKGLSSTLEARKSWFCAADTVICLGAGITARDGTPVETVVDNRNLGERGAPLLTVDGEAQPRDTGWSRSFPRAHWAHLEGHGGYVFPGGAPLEALREARTGAWRDINTGGAPDPLTRRYLTLRHPHGTDPVDASYAYLLMPGAGPRALAARAADPRWLTVLANTRDRQAVALPSLGLTAAAFWAPGAVGALAVTAPAAVLVRTRGRTATLSLSEPPRTGVPLDVVWSRPVRRVTAQDPSVRVLSTGSALRLRVTPGTACATHRCTVSLGDRG